jgi:hypothetical protein
VRDLFKQEGLFSRVETADGPAPLKGEFKKYLEGFGTGVE